MQVQFANGKTYNAKDIDDAISQCLAAGDDPFNPIVVDEPKQEKKKANADTVEQ